MQSAIEIAGLTKSFGPKLAVDRLDLTVRAGELIGLIGPNGAGKTTTIRMVMSILFPDSGSLAVLGRPSALESKDRIGYLPEERGVYKKMRVLPFLLYMARIKGFTPPDLRERALSWLDRLELKDVHKKKCEELSKGMQQKVQFIAAILHEPDLIILDEPFSGLDPVNARLLRSLIDQQHKLGRTIIFSTHQMSQAEALCDRVVMIHQGKKVLDDTPAAIRARFDPKAVLVEPQDAALAPFSSLPGVRRAEPAGRAVILHVEPGTNVPRLIAAAANAAPTLRVEAVRPSLEDVFVEIVTAGALSDQDRDTLMTSLFAESSRGGRAGD